MNQDASDAPQHDGDPTPQSDRNGDHEDVFADTESGQPDSTNDDVVSASAKDTELIDSSGETVIRVGSPFAVDPFAPDPAKKIEPFYDVGPLRYTAMGAVAASVMVLVFAATATWWFPAGGALIAALGCVLSIFGLYSTFRLASSGLLALHLSLFVLSYVRTLG